ncbi:hypothetical protein JXJ21_23945 [candidate division KSB1 bacterium]|nr:hypothetical protein [candidate division KSB1 bacterium]
MSHVEFEKMKIPKAKNIQFKFELQGEFNITSFVAKQKVNRYLLMNTGNLIHALEPDLVKSDSLVWKVPVGYSAPEKGFLGQIGYILIEAINGNLLLENSTSIREIEANAEHLYQQTSL